MLKQFLSTNTPSPALEPTDKLPSNATSTQLAEILSKNKVTKIKETALNSLTANGLPFDDRILQDILSQLFITQQTKFKKDATHPYSVILDNHGTPYALFHEKLGKGESGKVKLAQNLLTKEFVAVKIILQNKINTALSIANECQLLEKRKQFLGKQQRPKKKHYVFMKLLPGISISNLIDCLKESNIHLSQTQQKHLLTALLKTLLSLMEDNIHHDDIHSGNILIDPRNWEANIIDYGEAQDITTMGEHDFCFRNDLSEILYICKELNISAPDLKKLTRDLKHTSKDIITAVKKTLNTLKTMDLPGEALSRPLEAKPEQDENSNVNLNNALLNSNQNSNNPMPLYKVFNQKTLSNNNGLNVISSNKHTLPENTNNAPSNNPKRPKYS